jgi:hypothetical protein
LTGFGGEIYGQTLAHLQGGGTNPTVFKELLSKVQCADPASLTLTSYTNKKRPFLNRIDIMPVRNSAGVVTHHVLQMTELKTSRPLPGNQQTPFLDTLPASQLEKVKTRFTSSSSDTQSEDTSSEERDDDLGHLFLKEFDSNPFPTFLDMEQHALVGSSIFSNDLCPPQAPHAIQAAQQQQQQQYQQAQEEHERQQEEQAFASASNDAAAADAAVNNSGEQPKKKRCFDFYLSQRRIIIC